MKKNMEGTVFGRDGKLNINRNWLKYVMGSLLFGGFLFFSTLGFGSTWYVDPVSGNDGAVGSAALPWKTIQKAKSSATAGDTVNLLPGNYGAVVFGSGDNFGNSSGYITYQNNPGSAAYSAKFSSILFTGNHNFYIAISGLEVICASGSYGVKTEDAGYVKIMDCKIHGNSGGGGPSYALIYTSRSNNIFIYGCEVYYSGAWSWGVQLEGSDTVTVSHCHVHDIVGSGIRTGGGQNYTIEYNIVHDQRVEWNPDVHGSGIAIHSQNTILRGNIVYNFGNTRPIRFYQSYAGDDGYRNMLVENNLVYQTEDYSGTQWWSEFIDLGDNCVFRNNTFIGTVGMFFAKNADGSGLALHNNIITGNLQLSYDYYAPTGAGPGNTQWSNVSEGGNFFGGLCAKGCSYLCTYSRFSDTSTSIVGGSFGIGTFFSTSEAHWPFSNGYPYQLSAGSAAIGFAYTGNCPSVDILERARDGDPDGGAYEYGGGSVPVNHAPVLESIGDKSIAENQPLTFSVSATDPDGDPIEYSAQSLPSGAVFDSKTFSWAAAVYAGEDFQPQNYHVTFIASDGTLEDSETITITVRPADTDSDGLPDSWELPYFGNLDQNPQGDYDNDGFDNLEEYENGTDPTVFNEAPQNLVLHMKLDDDPGDGVRDSSPYKNDGYCSSQAMPVVGDGHFGSAYLYDGVDDCVSVADSNSLDAEHLTVAAWIYLNSYKDDQRIISKEFGTSQPYSIYTLLMSGVGEKKLEFRVGIGGTRIRIASNGDIPLNQWVHVAATYNGSSAVLYINGAVDRIYDSISGSIQRNDKAVYIGGSQFYNRFFDGGIDDARIYNEALDAEAIALLLTEEETFAFYPIGDREVDEATNLTFAVVTLDGDTVVVLEEHNLPGNPEFVDNIFNWTPTYDEAGNYDATFMAPNGQLEDFETISITVNNVNRMPVIDHISDKSVDESSNLTFEVTAVDPDGDDITYSAYNLPIGAGFSGQIFNWTPTGTQAGSYLVNFSASDGGQQAVEGVLITVNNVNNGPVLNPIGDKIADGSQTLTFTVAATDPDGDPIVYSAQNLPAGAMFSVNEFTWTPTDYQAGTYQVTIIASDGALQDSETFTITVIDSPEIDQSLVGHWMFDQTAGTTAIDSSTMGNDGSLVNGPVWTDGIVGGALSFDGTNDYVNCGSGQSLNLTGSLTIAAWINPESFGQGGWGRIVDKGTGSSSPSSGFSFFVEEYSKTIAYVIYGGQLVKSNVNVIELNKWQHVAAVYNSSANMVTFYVDGHNAGSAAYTTAPPASENAPLVIGIRGYDMNRGFDGLIDDVRVYNYPLTSAQILQLATVATNSPPVLDPIGDKTIDENEALSFTVTAGDPDGDSLVYSAQNLPAGAMFTSNVFTWTPTDEQAGTYQVTITASDGELQDSETFTITVIDSPVIDQSLVGHWMFDQAGGTTAIDSSTMGNDGSLVNGPVWTDGIVGGALSFDGNDDYVNCGSGQSLNLTGSLTIAAWINPESFGQKGWGRIVDRGTGSSGFSFFVEKRSKTIAYVIYGGKLVKSNRNVVELNKWQHVAAVYDSSTNTVTFYVDGHTAGNVSYKTAPPASEDAPLVIGIRGYDMNRGFDGLIDDVRVYNRALTVAEIAALK